MQAVQKVSGGVHVLDRADVDTDQIIPKQFLKRIERTGFGEFLFHDWRKDGLELDPECPILVTGSNFGCGSSREHAVWALEDFGFQAVVAPSFGDIFKSNASKIGLLTIELPERAGACPDAGPRGDRRSGEPDGRIRRRQGSVSRSIPRPNSVC